MLNVRRERFCQEYARCGNASEAYKAAGYKAKSDKAAGNCGSRLLENVGIQQRIAEITAELSKPVILSAEERQVMLTQIAKVCLQSGDYNAACKALDLLNKMQGSYINKVELGGPGGGPLEFTWAGGGDK